MLQTRFHTWLLSLLIHFHIWACQISWAVHSPQMQEKASNTHNIPSSSRSTGQIQTFPFASPGNALVSRNGEVLIGIPRATGIDLHFDAVGCRSTSDVETFVAVDDKVPVRNSPLGGNSRRATCLELNSSAIFVGGSSQTHGAARVRADSYAGRGRSGRSGCLRGRGAAARRRGSGGGIERRSACFTVSWTALAGSRSTITAPWTLDDTRWLAMMNRINDCVLGTDWGTPIWL